MAVADMAGLRRHSMWFSRVTLVLFLGTVAVAAFDLSLTARHNGAEASSLLRLAIRWLPGFFYLYALLAVQGAFQSFAKGGLLGTSVAVGCARAGWALAFGGGVSALGVSNLSWFLHETGLLEKRGWVGFMVFDVSYLAVGVVGLALILLARLLNWAGELQTEADTLRGELGSFF
jgi:hypothetical protein